jgi:CheY-like chemotaxis protein
VVSVSVLLVDDSPTFLRIAARFLGGYEDMAVVGTVQQGAEALPRAQQLRPDVVLVDLAMPDVPGLVAIPQLRAALPSLGIIAVSLFDAPAYRQAALGAGADAFVPKAALSTELLPAIRRLRRGRPTPPSAQAGPPPDVQPDGETWPGPGGKDTGGADTAGTERAVGGVRAEDAARADDEKNADENKREG